MKTLKRIRWYQIAYFMAGVVFVGFLNAVGEGRWWGIVLCGVGTLAWLGWGAQKDTRWQIDKFITRLGDEDIPARPDDDFESFKRWNEGR